MCIGVGTAGGMRSKYVSEPHHKVDGSTHVCHFFCIDLIMIRMYGM